MDELDRLRELLPEQPPPSERTQARARVRLLELAGESRSRRWSARRSAIRLAAAAVATAAVAALLVGPVLLTGVLTRPDDSRAFFEEAGTPSGPVTASSVLLDAARRLDGREPDPIGVYWRQRTLYTVPYDVGTATTYTVQDRTIQEQWLPSDPDGQPWIGSCDLGVWPETAADEQAWVRDGRPDKWVYSGHTLVRKPGACSINEVDGARLVLADNRNVDYRQLEDLPTDAEKLRTYLWRLRPSDDVDPEVYLYSAASRLLAELPAPPNVRSAALRLLASLPGLEYGGQVRDPVGRVGLAIDLADNSRDVRSTQRLIVDPGTGTLLARTFDTVTKQGTPLKQATHVYLSAEWTNAKPVAPDRTLR